MRIKKSLHDNWQLYLMLAPAMLILLVFNYMPIYGVQIAFRNFIEIKGIMGSPWIGLQNFVDFFESYYWKRLILNTILLNVFMLAFSFPIPIMLAILLNHTPSQKFKRFIQVVTYSPYFISVVVLSGMLYIFLSPSNGIINHIIIYFGGQPIDFMGTPEWFRTVYVGSGIWQTTGFNMILFLAALSGVPTELYEAATMDGANKMHKILYIDIPCILPMIIMVLILNSGQLFNSEFQKTYLLQTAGNLPVSDTIGVYVYKMGLLDAQYSYTAAIDLMKNVINFAMILVVNRIAKLAGQSGVM